MKLFEEFKKNRLERANEPAFLISSGDRALPITWRQFTDDIAAIAWLIESNIPHGVVGLIGENSYEWMAAHAACLFSGATVVPIDINLTAVEIAERLRFVGASVLVHSALYAEKAYEARKLVPGLIVGGFGSRRTDVFLSTARKAISLGMKTVFDRDEPDRERTSMIVFTSGTTSEPRGAELTISGIEAFCDAGQHALTMKEGYRSLMLLPLHHIFGVCTAYLMLGSGVALGVCPDFRRIYDAVERFRVDFLFLVPALADVLAAKIEQRARSAEEAFGSPLLWILTGGAPLSRRIYERLTALGIKTITGYGLTETTALYSISNSESEPQVGSAGLVGAVAGVEYKVSANGELMTRGPHVLRRYFKSPEETAKVLDKDGWFNTGDVGSIDEKGCVWITGRSSRTIVLSTGKKVAPEELEGKLMSLPGVQEAIVTGEAATREIRAELYANIPETSVHRLVGALNAQLPVYKRISKVVVRKEPFPRTSSGKIRLG